MAFALTVPQEYGYVILAAASTSILNIWLGSFVGSYRKAARVPYPNLYATAAEAATSKEKYLFNCAQRSHGQFLEQLPPFLVTLLVSGLKYPVLSAGLGAFWVVCRVFYAIGYTRPQFEGGKGRYWGAGYYIPTWTLLSNLMWLENDLFNPAPILVRTLPDLLENGSNPKQDPVLPNGCPIVQWYQIVTETGGHTAGFSFQMRSQLTARKIRSSSLSTGTPPQSSSDYSNALAETAAPILYRSPLPSQADLPVYILNAAAFPDANRVKYDVLLPYVLARLPNDEDLIGGKGYELIFFAGEEERSASAPKKARPGWAWILRAYNVLSRLIRKRLQKLYLVHQRSWVKVTVEMFSTVVSPKVRRKIVHVSSLSGLALHIPIENLLIPPSVYLCDRRIARDIYVPYVTGRRAFGVRIPLPISAEGTQRLPRVLRESTSFVLTDQNVKTEGLFRTNARAVTVSILKEAYDRGQKFIVWKEADSVLTFSHWQEGHGNIMVEEHQYVEGFSLTTATALINLWYAELQEPIFPQASYSFLRNIFDNSPGSVQTSAIIDLMGEASDWSPISRVSRQILTMHLLPLLATVARYQDWNKMTPHNLAICFAPALLRGPDTFEDLNIISTVSRVLEYTVTHWDTGLAAALGMDKWKFDELLHAPEAIEDREDPLDSTVCPTIPQQFQTDGVTLIDNDVSDDEEGEERPPLPPRTSNSGEDEEDRPPLPPRINMLQLCGQHPEGLSITRRKPAPVLQGPPRYSTIFTQSPVSTEDLPVYAIVANGRFDNPSNIENSMDGGLPNIVETAVSRKPVPSSSDHA